MNKKWAVVLCLTLSSVLYAKEKPSFYVYLDDKAPVNHYIPSGWMGDYGDLRFENSFIDPRGKSSIKITYSGKMTQQAGWAGIFWQVPQNNWGNKEGGFDLSAFKKLTFFAKGEKGTEVLAEAGAGGIDGEHADSDKARIYQIHLTKNWKEYTVDLASLNMSHIIGGFVFAMSRDDNPDGAVFYLDDIRYE